MSSGEVREARLKSPGGDPKIGLHGADMVWSSMEWLGVPSGEVGCDGLDWSSGFCAMCLPDSLSLASEFKNGRAPASDVPADPDIEM
jgi:hypothetical protein